MGKSRDLSSEEIRNQLNSLKDFIDAVPARPEGPQGPPGRMTQQAPNSAVQRQPQGAAGFTLH